ncbi:MAG: hypothetical protein WD876_00655 [Candidatus Pacearchaeota archaeon]
MEEKRDENSERRETGSPGTLDQTEIRSREPKNSLLGKVFGWFVGLSVVAGVLYANSGQSELRKEYRIKMAVVDSLYNPQIRVLENEKEAIKDSIKKYFVKERNIWGFGR